MAIVSAFSGPSGGGATHRAIQFQARRWYGACREFDVQLTEIRHSRMPARMMARKRLLHTRRGMRWTLALASGSPDFPEPRAAGEVERRALRNVLRMGVCANASDLSRRPSCCPAVALHERRQACDRSAHPRWVLWISALLAKK